MVEIKQLLCPREKCTGCMACRNICPKDAVYVTYDKLDCTIPTVDEKLCTRCGLCRKVCPSVNKISTSGDELTKQNCYAVWTNNLDDRKTCSSGGVATTLSKYFIENSGVVFGAAFDNSLILHHKMVSNETGIESLKGSKYLQSDIRYTYREAKKELDSGKSVLFIGTPCQIAGLYGFLQREYDNLITLDLICHGTPPNSYLLNHINSKYPKNNITSVSFRGERDFYFSTFENEDLISTVHLHNDLFFHSFVKRLTYRESCYSCPYANINRIGDITIGDFWELDKKSLNPAYGGHVSVILLNTANGMEIFEKTKSLFTWQKRTTEEAIHGNEQLQKPVSAHKSRHIFKWIYPKLKFEKSVNIIYFYIHLKNKLKK